MTEIDVQVRSDPRGGFYVYWETATAYGGRGSELTREQAEWLAEQFRTGEAQP